MADQSDFGADDRGNGIVIATMLVEDANRRAARNGQVEVAFVENLGVPKAVQLAEGANDRTTSGLSFISE